MTLEEWQSKGKTITVNQRKLFVIDEGEETVVILHGYPSCSFDYWKILPALSSKYRVIIHDHLGFGLSDKPLDYSYSLIEQADFALALWQELGLENVTLLAHDYGTSVATEIVAKAEKGYSPIKIKSLILCNGSMLIELAHLRVVQKLLRSKLVGPWLARISPQFIFGVNMAKLWFDKTKVDKAELALLWEFWIMNDGRAVMHQITQYLRERSSFWHRWIGALQQTEIPINLIWAKEDPVAVKAIAEKLHDLIPTSSLIWIEKTGHYPMLENPEAWVQEVLKILEKE